ncbi:hypothetical protein OG21DRAFT_1490447 [Imleria badia]|nr:hypothetical protein OG21DRAFT_1490447 [Imleria badia]
MSVPRKSSAKSWVTSLACRTPPLPELTRTITDIEYTWRKRKPTHLPPLLKLSPFSSSFDGPDSPTSLITPMSTYHRRGSVLSVAPSIISNAPSTASASSTSDAPPDSTQRRTKLERLRRKLRAEVPTTAVFPTTPRTAHPHAQDLHLHIDAQALTLRTHTHHRPSSRPSRRHTHPRVLDQLRREHTYGRAVRAYAPPAIPAQDKSTSSDPAKRWPQVPRSPLTDQ